MKLLYSFLFSFFAFLVIFPLHASAMCNGMNDGLSLESISASPYSVTMSTGDREITTSQQLTIDVMICSNDNVAIERLKIDATMPAHGHGMNYVPEIKDKGENRYTASGLLLHMPGMWRFEVSFNADGSTHRFIRDIEIE